MSNEPKVKPKSRGQIARETIGGLVLAGIGAALIFRPPEIFGVSALYIGALFVGAGAFAANKKLTAEWMVQVRELLSFWKRGE